MPKSNLHGSVHRDQTDELHKHYSDPVMFRSARFEFLAKNHAARMKCKIWEMCLKGERIEQINRTKRGNVETWRPTLSSRRGEKIKNPWWEQRVLIPPPTAPQRPWKYLKSGFLLCVFYLFTFYPFPPQRPTRTWTPPPRSLLITYSSPADSVVPTQCLCLEEEFVTLLKKTSFRKI